MIQDDAKIAFACMLMVDEAGVWLRLKYPDPSSFIGVSWSTFKATMIDSFKP